MARIKKSGPSSDLKGLNFDLIWEPFTKLYELPNTRESF